MNKNRRKVGSKNQDRKMGMGVTNRIRLGVRNRIQIEIKKQDREWELETGYRLKVRNRINIRS